MIELCLHYLTTTHDSSHDFFLRYSISYFASHCDMMRGSLQCHS